MTHTIIVTVETDDNHADAPTTDQLTNEIRAMLEYDNPHTSGILLVDVRAVPYSYRAQVAGSIEQ